MRVLSVSSEVYPLIKTGGLADVAGALPPALGKLDIEVRTVLPGYRRVLARDFPRKKVATLKGILGQSVDVLAGTDAGLDLYIIDCPALFDRDGGPYGGLTGADHPDNWLRFGVMSKAAAMIAQGVLPGYKADIVHAHDWQAAMTLAYLKYADEPAPASVMTVHNLAFQGQFAAALFNSLDLPSHAWSVEGVEYYGDVGFLKAGLQAASAITTVSPTYAQEIRRPEFGMGLDGLINARADVLHGIVNGIDTDVWNPATDPLIVAAYSAANMKTRAKNRAALMDRFHLEDTGAPVLTLVSRLTWQKGIDILSEALEGIAATGARVAILGSGDKALEGALLAAASRHRGQIGVIIGYDEALSHLMQAGGDATLVPSRFEPCGLTQLYGLRYGCIPVVAPTGGLADTVIDANMAALNAGVATGFHIHPLTPYQFVETIQRLCMVYSDQEAWVKMQANGMATDVSWDKSALAYSQLYTSLLEA